MKNKKILGILSVASLLSVAGVAALAGSNALVQARALEPNQFYHYTGFDATCEKGGLKSYYTNCNNLTVTELPAEATVVGERVATEADLAYIKAADPSDERLIPAKNHDFDPATGVCVHHNEEKTTDLISTFSSASNGIQTLAETSEVVAGFDKIYSLTRTYSTGTAWHIHNPFADVDVTGYDTISFYISTLTKELMFAGDDGEKATGHEIHPNASFGDTGVVTVTNLGSGNWTISASGFKFRRMSDGAAVSSFDVTGRTTLNDLFHGPATDAWGANVINISEIHLTGNFECGAVSLIGSAIGKSHLLTKGAEETGLGHVYAAPSAALKYGVIDHDITGYDEIRFSVHNSNASNTFILRGNSTNCSGGIYGGSDHDDVVIATRNGTSWTVKTESGANFFTLSNGDWGSAASYTVNNVTSFKDVFNFFTDSPDVQISDIVAKGTPSSNRQVITEDAINVYNNSSQGTTTLTDTGETVVGFGKKYLYESFYYASTTTNPVSSYFKEYDLTDVKTVEFYIQITSSDLPFVDADGGYANSWSLHSGAGAQNPGIIRAVQTEAGTWVVNGYGIAFRNMSSGAQANSFTYTGRSTLGSIFNNPRTWGPSTIYLSDIVVTR